MNYLYRTQKINKIKNKQLKEYVEYIKRNRTHYESMSDDIEEALLGLAAEVGEAIGVFQKATRKGWRPNKDDIKSELGDVLYYLVTVAYHYGFNLEDLIKSNEEKLRSRGWDK